MDQDQINRNRAFIKDLRANTGKEGHGQLFNHATGDRCCLGVALDSAIAQGFIPARARNDYEIVPPSDIAAFYGWPARCPLLRKDGRENAAMYLNDEMKLSHDKIADWFESTFPEIKPTSNVS